MLVAAAACAAGFRISTGAKNAASSSSSSFKAVQEEGGGGFESGSPSSSFEWHSSGRKCNVPLHVIDLITLLPLAGLPRRLEKNTFCFYLDTLDFARTSLQSER